MGTGKTYERPTAIGSNYDIPWEELDELTNQWFEEIEKRASSKPYGYSGQFTISNPLEWKTGEGWTVNPSTENPIGIDKDGNIHFATQRDTWKEELDFTKPLEIYETDTGRTGKATYVGPMSEYARNFPSWFVVKSGKTGNLMIVRGDGKCDTHEPWVVRNTVINNEDVDGVPVDFTKPLYMGGYGIELDHVITHIRNNLVFVERTDGTTDVVEVDPKTGFFRNSTFDRYSNLARIMNK